jgi:hypothetical protein
LTHTPADHVARGLGIGIDIGLGDGGLGYAGQAQATAQHGDCRGFAQGHSFQREFHFIYPPGCKLIISKMDGRAKSAGTPHPPSDLFSKTQAITKTALSHCFYLTIFLMRGD